MLGEHRAGPERHPQDWDREESHFPRGMGQNGEDGERPSGNSPAVPKRDSTASGNIGHGTRARSGGGRPVALGGPTHLCPGQMDAPDGPNAEEPHGRDVTRESTSEMTAKWGTVQL